MSLSVLAAAREAPSAVALVVGERAVSFGELAGLVGRRVVWLEEAGIRPLATRPVAVIGRSDLSTLCLVYALVEFGCPVALVHPRLTEAERARVVSLVDPALVVERAPEDASTPDRHPSLSPPAAVPDEAPLAVLFTSGTTGEPKGVVLTRRAFVASALASAENLPLAPGDRWLLGLPVAHVGGLSVLTRSLLARSTVVVPAAVAEGARLDPGALATCLEEQRVTLVSLVPTQLEWLLSRDPPWAPPRSLRAVLLGGAAARPTLLERAAERGVPVLTTYGLTEACSQVTTQQAGTLNRGDAGSGVPLAGTEVKLVDGAICVRGPTLFSGYLTARGPAAPLDADGFFHTDDLGRFDAAGRLHVLGRRSDLIVTGGENVYPAEVEGVVERCPGVAAACVFGVPDETWGEVVAVAVVETAPESARAEALDAFCRAELASHRRPRRFAVVDALAVTPAGKLDRAGTARAAGPRLRPLGGA